MVLPKTSSHMHLWIEGYHSTKLLKLSLGLVGFHEKACAAAERGRRSELRLVRKRRTKRGEGKEMLKRQRASIV
jgi:hypothetical protein